MRSRCNGCGDAPGAHLLEKQSITHLSSIIHINLCRSTTRSTNKINKYDQQIRSTGRSRIVFVSTPVEFPLLLDISHALGTQTTAVYDLRAIFTMDFVRRSASSTTGQNGACIREGDQWYQFGERSVDGPIAVGQVLADTLTTAVRLVYQRVGSQQPGALKAAWSLMAQHPRSQALRPRKSEAETEANLLSRQAEAELAPFVEAAFSANGGEIGLKLLMKMLQERGGWVGIVEKAAAKLALQDVRQKVGAQQLEEAKLLPNPSIVLLELLRSASRNLDFRRPPKLPQRIARLDAQVHLAAAKLQAVQRRRLSYLYVDGRKAAVAAQFKEDQ